jgi:hypothetical protein
MKKLASTAVVLAILVIVSSCDSETAWQSGDYEVYWIDLPSELTLGRKLQDGSNSIGRVGPQVFAVGSDDRWVVAARYPDGDKTNAEYFYFEKSTDRPYKNSDQVVLGPFNEKEFEALKRRHGLPNRSKYF